MLEEDDEHVHKKWKLTKRENGDAPMRAVGEEGWVLRKNEGGGKNGRDGRLCCQREQKQGREMVWGRRCGVGILGNKILKKKKGGGVGRKMEV